MQIKSKKNFEFEMPVTKLSFKPSLNTPKMIGSLLIIGIGYDLGQVTKNEARLSGKLEAIIYDDLDLLPIFKAFESFQPFLDEVYNAIHHHVENFLFKSEELLTLQLADHE